MLFMTYEVVFYVLWSQSQHDIVLYTCMCSNMTTIRGYHFKGHEPYKQLLHVVYSSLILSSSLYILLPLLKIYDPLMIHSLILQGMPSMEARQIQRDIDKIRSKQVQFL